VADYPPCQPQEPGNQESACTLCALGSDDKSLSLWSHQEESAILKLTDKLFGGSFG